MLYSLTVVQPKVTRFFTDEQCREEFLLALAHGNRWRVLALATVLILTGLSVTMVGPATWPSATPARSSSTQLPR